MEEKGGGQAGGDSFEREYATIPQGPTMGSSEDVATNDQRTQTFIEGIRNAESEDMSMMFLDQATGFYNTFLASHHDDMSDTRYNDMVTTFKHIKRNLAVAKEESYSNGRLNTQTLKLASRLHNEMLSVMQYDAPRQSIARQGRQELPHSMSGGAYTRAYDAMEKKIVSQLVNTQEYIDVNSTSRYASGDLEGKVQNLYAQRQVVNMEMQLWMDDDPQFWRTKIGTLQQKIDRLSNLINTASLDLHGSAGGMSKSRGRRTGAYESQIPPRQSMNLRGGGRPAAGSKPIKHGAVKDEFPVYTAQTHRLNRSKYPNRLKGAIRNDIAALQEDEDNGVVGNHLKGLLDIVDQHMRLKTPTDEIIKTIRGGLAEAWQDVGPEDMEMEVRHDTGELLDNQFVNFAKNRTAEQLNELGEADDPGYKRMLRAMVTENDPEEIFRKFGVRAKTMTGVAKHFGENLLDKEASVVNILNYLQMYGVDLDSSLNDVRLQFKTGSGKNIAPNTSLKEFISGSIRTRTRGDPGARSFPGPRLADWYATRDQFDRPATRILGKGKGTNTQFVKLFNVLKYKGVYIPDDVDIEQLYVFKPSFSGLKKGEPSEMVTPQEMHRNRLFMEGKERNAYTETVFDKKGKPHTTHYPLRTTRKGFQSMLPFYRHMDLFTDEFFKQPTSVQVAELHKKARSGPLSNPQTWYDACTEFFGVDPKQLGERETKGGFGKPQQIKIWGIFERKIKNLLTQLGPRFTAGDVFKELQFQNQGVTPSRERQSDRDKQALAGIRLMGFGLEDEIREEAGAVDESLMDEYEDLTQGVADMQEAEMGDTDKASLKAKVLAGFSAKYEDVVVDYSESAIASGLGVNLAQAFWKSFLASNQTLQRGGSFDAYRGSVFKTLQRIVPKKNKRDPSSTYSYIFPQKPFADITDGDARNIIFVKMGWNEYIKQQTLKKGTTRAQYAFSDVPELDEAMEVSDGRMFDSSQAFYVRQLLLSHCAAYMLKAAHDQDETFSYDSAAADIVKIQSPIDHFRELAHTIRGRYEHAIRTYGEGTIPVPDWEERLQRSQYSELQKEINKFEGAEGGRRKVGARTYQDQLAFLKGKWNPAAGGARKRPPKRSPKPSTPRERLAARQSRDRSAARGSRSLSRSLEDVRQTEPPELEPDSDVDDWADKEHFDRMLQQATEMAADEIGPIMGAHYTQDQRNEVVTRYLIQLEELDDLPIEDRFEVELDIEDEAQEVGIAEALERDNEAFERMIQLGVLPSVGPQHRYNLRSDAVSRHGLYQVQARHLLQTDNNVAPVMGRVHMVRPARNFSDKHFMVDMHGDINEGQKSVVERSRRGPFRGHGGRSTIMDRSAHITYRKRRGVFEITIRKGVQNAEMDQMTSKLQMHRMHQDGSRVTIIKGTRRYRLGRLRDLDLNYLIELIADCVSQYGHCGIEIVEERSGSGPLYRGSSHGVEFKMKSRNSKGAIHVR